MKVGTGGGAAPIPKPPGRGGASAPGRQRARQNQPAPPPAPPSRDFTRAAPKFGGGNFGAAPHAPSAIDVHQRAEQTLHGEIIHAALTTPDAATKRLIELTFNHDANGNPTTPKFGSQQFIASASKSLANRPGAAGAASYFTLASIGVPVSQYAPQKAHEVLHYIDAAAKAGKPIIAPNVEFLSPGQRQTIAEAVKKRGITPPPGASDSELVNALHQHKLGVGDIVSNLPSDLAQTAIGIPGGLAATAVAGGMAAGGLARLATGQPVGNRFEPGAALLGGVKQQYEGIARHPLAALEKHPAQTAAALWPSKALVGKVAGRTAEAGMLGEAAQGLARATERPALALPRVSADASNPITLEGAARAPFAPAFENRAAQALTDKIIGRSPRLQRRELDRASVKAMSAQTDLGYQARAAQLREIAKATNPSVFKKVPKDEQTAAVFAHGQGVKPSQWLAYYEHRLTQVTGYKRGPIEHQIKLWQAVTDKYGDNVTPPMQRIIDAARGAVAVREDVMKRVAGVPEDQMQARRVLTQNHVLDTLRSQIPAEEHATHPLLEPAATQPFYVPHTQGAPELKYFLSRRSRNYNKQIADENRQNTLALVQSGKLNPSMTAFTSKLARVPLIERGMIRMQDQVTRFGKPAAAESRVPEGFVAVHAEPGRIVTLTDKGATAERALHETLQHIGEDNAALKTALDQHVLIAKSGGTIPAGIEDAILLPDRVYKNITGDGAVRNLMRHPVLRGAQVATDWWRYITLRLRPAWLAYNLVSNTGQALLGMASSPAAVARIPSSLVRAAKPEYRAAIEQAAPELASGGMQTALAWHQNPGSLMDTGVGRVVSAANRAARVTGIPQAVGGLANFTGWANMAHENYLRRVVYLHRALPLAKADAGTRRVTASVMDNLANNRYEQAARDTAQWLGNFSGGKQRPGLRLAMPFYKWYGFVIKLALWDLPVHSPGRTALLAQLGRIGDEEYQKFGLGLSKTFAGALPVDITRVKQPDGSYHVEATLGRTQGVNSASTLAGLSNPEAIARSMNPLASSLFGAALGVDPSTGFTNRNAAGQVVSMFPGLGKVLGGSAQKTTSNPSDLGRVVLNSLWQSTPLAALVDPQSGQAETNLPFSQYTGIGAAKAPSSAFSSSQAPTLGQRVASYLGAPYRRVDLTQANWNALSHETPQSLLGFTVPTGKTKTTPGGSVVETEAQFEAWKQQHPEAAFLTRTELYRLQQLLIEARVHAGGRQAWGQPSGFGSHRPDANTPAALALKAQRAAAHKTKMAAKKKTKKASTPAATPSGAGSIYGGGSSGGGGGANSIYG